MSMIAQKQQAFRLQIRTRTHSLTQHKLRYENNLHSSPTSIRISQQFLHLLSQCKLSNNKYYSIPHTNTLIQFIYQKMQQSWIGYLCVCREIVMYDLLTVICGKIADFRRITEVIQGIIKGKDWYVNDNNVEIQGKQCIQNVYSVLIRKSAKSISKRMIKQLYQLLYTNAATINKIHSISYIINKISQYTNTHEFLPQILPQSSSLCSVSLSQNNTISIIQSLSYILYRNIGCLHVEQLYEILQLISYIFKCIDNKLMANCHNHINNYYQCNYCHNAESDRDYVQHIKQIKKQTQVQILRTLNQIFIWNANKYSQYLHHQNMSEILLQLLGYLSIKDEKYYQLVTYVIKNNINTTNRCKNTAQNQQYKWEIIHTCIKLIHKITFEQIWIDYQHVNELINHILTQICIYYQDSAYNNTVYNPFTTPNSIFNNNNININNFEINHFSNISIGSCSSKSLLRTYIPRIQHLLLKTLINILTNQCQYKPTYDYYTVLQNMSRDVIKCGIFNIWINNNNSSNSSSSSKEGSIINNDKQLLGEFVNLLLNAKEESIKKELVKICWPLAMHTNRKKGSVAEKLRLYSKLYGIHLQSLNQYYHQDIYEQQYQFDSNYLQDQINSISNEKNSDLNSDMDTFQDYDFY